MPSQTSSSSGEALSSLSCGTLALEHLALTALALGVHVSVCPPRKLGGTWGEKEECVRGRKNKKTMM